MKKLKRMAKWIGKPKVDLGTVTITLIGKTPLLYTPEVWWKKIFPVRDFHACHFCTTHSFTWIKELWVGKSGKQNIKEWLEFGDFRMKKVRVNFYGKKYMERRGSVGR
jgi:hypothetical protein